MSPPLTQRPSSGQQCLLPALQDRQPETQTHMFRATQARHRLVSLASSPARHGAAGAHRLKKTAAIAEWLLLLEILFVAHTKDRRSDCPVLGGHGDFNGQPGTLSANTGVVCMVTWAQGGLLNLACHVRSQSCHTVLRFQLLT